MWPLGRLQGHGNNAIVSHKPKGGLDLKEPIGNLHLKRFSLKEPIESFVLYKRGGNFDLRAPTECLVFILAHKKRVFERANRKPRLTEPIESLALNYNIKS